MPLASAYFPPAPAADADAPAATLPERTAADVPASVLGLIVALAAAGLTTTNGPLTAAALLVLAAILKLLWRPGEPPVLLFAIGFQWLQVTAKVFHADTLGIYIELLSPSPNVAAATWLSLIGLVVLSAGVRIALWRAPLLGARIRESADGLSVGRAFWLYVGTAIGAALLKPMAWAFGPLTQILLSVADVKWGAFFLLAYLVFVRREGIALFLAAFAIEFLGGIGYFSGFKLVIFVTVIALMATRPRITFGTAAGGLVAVVALMLFGSVWTVVKPEFRSILSDGASSQRVSAGRSAQLESLGRLVGSLGWGDVVGGLDPMFRRIAYTDYFALTMDYIPASRPYGQGELWGMAVRHVLQPRLFFPNKPALLSDSEVTMEYTGQFLASDNEGTSISIGYMGEAYADFGRVGMFGVVLAIGLAWGLMFGFFARTARAPVLGLAFALAVLLSAYQFEMASIKLLGGVVTKFLVLAVVFRLFEGQLVAWLRGESAPADEAAAGTDYVAQASLR